MLLSEKVVNQYKDLPRKHKSEIHAKFRTRFQYKSSRRIAEIFKLEIHPTPEEHEFLTETITRYSDFFRASPSQIQPCNHFRIVQ